MCGPSCITFATTHLQGAEVRGKSVLEVGSLDVNGSVRRVVERLGPASYLGVDIMPGRGVDEICEVGDLVQRYGANHFDLVISTELVEHVRDWRDAMSNLKNVVKPGGVLLVTTRSKGCPYHGYPYDFWRYEERDLREIFADFSSLEVERDPGDPPGVFLKAEKPESFVEKNLSDVKLWSIITRRRCRAITDADLRTFAVRWAIQQKMLKITPMFLRRAISGFLKKHGWR